MRTSMLAAVLILCTAHMAAGQTGRTTLDIYVVDVEGGNAVLFVAPSGQSLFWAGLNKGKRSIQVDLRSDEGRERAG